MTQLFQKACDEFQGKLLNKKVLGEAVKQAFPHSKRQHDIGPYSYYGLKQRITSTMQSASSTQRDRPNCVSVGCQVAEVSAYDVPRETLTAIPRDRFLDREMLHPFEGKHDSLGEGSFSRVYIMQYRKFYVAVKEYKEIPDYTLKYIRERLLREAKTLINIAPHRCIPMFFGVVCNSRPFMLVMQLCTRQYESLTLMKLIVRNSEIIADNELLTIMCRLAATLHHVHQNGFLHNDLKVDNVVLVKDPSVNRQWQPMMIDFGEATRLAMNFRKKYRSFHAHIDPEVLSGAVAHSFRSDIYSLGVIFSKVTTITSSKEVEQCLLKAHSICTHPKNRPRADALESYFENFMAETSSNSSHSKCIANDTV